MFSGPPSISSEEPEHEKVFFTVITPTWNRGHLLPKVFASLVAQTYTNFEWIISDNGSEDGTDSLVMEFAQSANFRIVYIRYDLHVGKTVSDNRAIGAARGELILWCDSDDTLAPQALRTLNDDWHSDSKNVREFCGMAAVACSEDGDASNGMLPAIPISNMTWNEFVTIHNVTGDMLLCIRADLLKANQFPEVDLYMPESVVWSKLGNKQISFLPEPLLFKVYRSNGAVSFTNRLRYNRGRAYSIALSGSAGTLCARHKALWLALTFQRYAVHGEITSKETRRLWRNSNLRGPYWLLRSVAHMICFVDRARGRVDYSHREFLSNLPKAQVQISEYERFHMSRDNDSRWRGQN